MNSNWLFYLINSQKDILLYRYYCRSFVEGLFCSSLTVNHYAAFNYCMSYCKFDIPNSKTQS